MNDTLKTLMERRSVRSYKPDQIPEDVLEQILLAGEYAPSGMGMQSAVMVAVQDPETIRTLSRINAEIMGTDGDPFYGAPTVVVVLADHRRGTCVEDGSLVLRKIETGRSILGDLLEVVSGVSREDYLADPSGEGVKEGAYTEAVYGEEMEIGPEEESGGEDG